MISAHHWQWYHHSASSSSSSSPHSPQHYGPNGHVMIPNGSPTVNVTNCGDVAPGIQQGNVFIVNVTFTNLLTAFTHNECSIQMCYSLVKPISFGVVLLNIFSILLHLFILAKDWLHCPLVSYLTLLSAVLQTFSVKWWYDTLAFIYSIEIQMPFNLNHSTMILSQFVKSNSIVKLSRYFCLFKIITWLLHTIDLKILQTFVQLDFIAHFPVKCIFGVL